MTIFLSRYPVHSEKIEKKIWLHEHFITIYEVSEFNIRHFIRDKVYSSNFKLSKGEVSRNFKPRLLISLYTVLTHLHLNNFSQITLSDYAERYITPAYKSKVLEAFEKCEVHENG